MLPCYATFQNTNTKYEEYTNINNRPKRRPCEHHPSNSASASAHNLLTPSASNLGLNTTLLLISLTLSILSSSSLSALPSNPLLHRSDTCRTAPAFTGDVRGDGIAKRTVGIPAFSFCARTSALWASRRWVKEVMLAEK